MAILNATTAIEVIKTVNEIQAILVKAGARSVNIDYDDKKEPSGLSFELNGEHFELPCRSQAIYKLLRDDTSLKRSQRTPEQALRVAWRIIRTWLLAQLAIVQTGMVELNEVMLPYAVVERGRTVYQVYREQRAERLLEKK